MANLLAEYRSRHRVKFALPLDEGVLFFVDRKQKPTLICLTSSASRQHTTCRRCLRVNSGLVCELFVAAADVTSVANVTEWCALIGHEHVDPDVDLCVYVNERCSKFGQLEPFVAKNERCIEGWLWEFYAQQAGLFDKRKTVVKDVELRCLVQMMECLLKQRHLFEPFYQLYQTFLLGRRYVLIG